MDKDIDGRDKLICDNCGNDTFNIYPFVVCDYFNMDDIKTFCAKCEKEVTQLQEDIMDSRERIAISVYQKVYEMMEDLAHRSNATETIFVRDIQTFCKNKIEHYSKGGT